MEEKERDESGDRSKNKKTGAIVKVHMHARGPKGSDHSMQARGCVPLTHKSRVTSQC